MLVKPKYPNFNTPYEAGYDAAQMGASFRNCHLGFFSTPERTIEWQRGQKDAHRDIAGLDAQQSSTVPRTLAADTSAPQKAEDSTEREATPRVVDLDEDVKGYLKCIDAACYYFDRKAGADSLEALTRIEARLKGHHEMLPYATRITSDENGNIEQRKISWAEMQQEKKEGGE